MPEYIPLPWADPKWTMKLQSVDNEPIEIQCCQLLNIHTHKPRNDTDITQTFGETTALKSKHDECN